MPRTSNRVAAMRKLPTKCARTIAAELLEAIARRKILATVAMGSAIFGMSELIASPSNAGGSLARLAVLALLVALGLAVYVACLELLGVARVHDLLAAVRRLCAGLAPAPRVMASGGAIGEGFRHGLQGASVFRRAADRQPAPRQLSRRHREVRRVAG